MDEFEHDASEQDLTTADDAAKPAENVKANVAKVIKVIKSDKEFHKKSFARMKRDQHIAKYGALPDWPEGNYRANIAGRHVKQKTAALYAKNPKAVARRRETMDFTVWDENPDNLKLAFMTMQQMGPAYQMQAQAAAAAPPMIDPKSGLPVQMALPPPPPELAQAQAVMEDFQQGIQRRQLIQRIGKTLEIVFAHQLHEQKPLDFKMAMKKVVRRACTTAVGYVELNFQREMGPRPGVQEQLTDARTRLDHVKRLMEEAQEEEFGQDDAEMAELEASIASLQAEPEIVLREGLIVDFPPSTRVIPDRLCKSLVGFVGARHVTVEYLFTTDEVEEIFGVDLGKKYVGYGDDGKATDGPDQGDLFVDDHSDGMDRPLHKGKGLVLVWKHYDKPSGLVYYVADGYDDYLREPAAPEVFVEDFWPLYALTFNDVEHEDELYPPSDVALICDMAMEYNRSRQGKREHRQAARPRWGGTRGALEQEDIDALRRMQPFDVHLFNKDPQTKLSEILEVLPVPGVDPNLYDTGELFTDMQLVVGTSEAVMGGISKATATESAIAAGSSSSSDGSSIDDLDSFLTVISRAAGQILLREMSEDQVKRIAGPGAVWPQLTLADIAEEIQLEVEAGSTGKPNQAVEIQNWKSMLPFLIQLGSIQPDWLAKETLRRLDDKMDLTDAIVSGIPSIVAQNSQKQPGPADPAANPAAQGEEGAQNGPPPPGNTGSGPAFGSNQV